MSDIDHEAYRAESSQHWDEAAPGWLARQQQMRTFAAPVAQWLVSAVAPRPGSKILELAAGVGDTGLLAAERVLPAGEVIVSDQSPAMLDGARLRVAHLGLANVTVKVINAEWIDLPVATVDGVLCRWGYMLMVDPTAALKETRRVLAPGGRVALAVWDATEHNPWLALPGRELVDRGLVQPPVPNAPGPFALADADRLSDLLGESGFAEVEIDHVDLHRDHRTFDDFWETTLDMTRSVHDAVMDRPAVEIVELRNAIATRLAPFTAADGSLRIPGRTLVAAATA